MDGWMNGSPNSRTFPDAHFAESDGPSVVDTNDSTIFLPLYLSPSLSPTWDLLALFACVTRNFFSRSNHIKLLIACFIFFVLLQLLCFSVNHRFVWTTLSRIFARGLANCLMQLNYHPSGWSLVLVVGVGGWGCRINTGNWLTNYDLLSLYAAANKKSSAPDIQLGNTQSGILCTRRVD